MTNLSVCVGDISQRNTADRRSAKISDGIANCNDWPAKTIVQAEPEHQSAGRNLHIGAESACVSRQMQLCQGGQLKLTKTMKGMNIQSLISGS